MGIGVGVMKQCKKKRQKWNQIGTAYADKPGRRRRGTGIGMG